MTATARRGHGEGSVYRDAANGTWVGAISLGWRPDGTRIGRKVTGRTKTETIYRHELRPVITTSADMMHRIFTQRSVRDS